MENPTYSFSETNLAFQLEYELQNKSKIVIGKEKGGHFLYRLFCSKKVFLTYF